MVSTKNTVTRGDSVIMADGELLNLRNRYLAVILAWLIPGAGHFYQRRYAKSSIFFLSILSSFALGMFVGGGRCVYASWNSVEKRWQYVIQAGIGLPAMPAAYQAYYGKPGQFMAPPSSTDDLSQWNAETASGMDMGTLYTMIAGLLNMLVMFDAFAGPLPPPTTKPKGEKDSTGDDKKPAPPKAGASGSSSPVAQV